MAKEVNKAKEQLDKAEKEVKQMSWCVDRLFATTIYQLRF